MHRELEAVGLVPAPQALRQAACFAAENEHVATAERGIPDEALSELREQPERPATQLRFDVAPGIDGFPVEMLPVIHPSPLQIAIIEQEPERSHQPQLGADSNAAASDVPGVLRDIGLIQDDVEERFAMAGCG